MTTIAVLADIHGNRWALEAVLEDLARVPDAMVLNLGDSLWGPLDPSGTADLLMAQRMRHVRGNTDREMLDSRETPSLTDAHSLAALTPARHLWLAAHEPPFIMDDVLACHGTPKADDKSLLEAIGPYSVFPHPRRGGEVAAKLKRVPPTVTLVLCGH